MARIPADPVEVIARAESWHDSGLGTGSRTKDDAMKLNPQMQSELHREGDVKALAAAMPVSFGLGGDRGRRAIGARGFLPGQSAA